MGGLTRVKILAALFAALAAVLWVWLTPCILASARSPSYIPVTGKVVQTQVLRHRNKSGVTWDVEVRYSYTVNGHEYQNCRIQGAQVWQPFLVEDQAAAYASGFPAGHDILVFHDPLWPSLSTRTQVPDEWPVMLLMPCMPTAISIVLALLARRQRRKLRIET